MIFGEGPIIKNIARDLNKLFLQGTRAGQPILNVEGDAAADQGTKRLLNAPDAVTDVLATSEFGQMETYEIAYAAKNLVFTGNNYIDTGVYLYSQENINRDFEVEIKITADMSIQPDSQTVVLNSMLESRPYPGFVLRRAGNSVSIAGSGSGSSIPPTLFRDNAIYMSRHGGEYSLSCGSISYDTKRLGIRTTVFDVPVTLGAGLNESGQPFRYFIGTIDWIRILLY